MRKTTHAQDRMNHRAIKNDLIDLVIDRGETDGDKIVLNQEACELEIAELKVKQKKLEHAAKKGGLTVVCIDGVLITAYRANSFSASKAKKVRG